ncbi:3687_t:CDS:2, partial [Racocetra fulgida]
IEESTMENLYSDEFDSLSDNNNEERNSSDEELASTSTSTSKLSSIRTKKKRKSGSFVWQFFKKYVSTVSSDNQEEAEKVQSETMSSFLPSDDEFELLNELIIILSPFDEATQFLSGSKYPTLGFMTPMLEELTRRLRQFTGQIYKAILVKDTILNNLVERWGDPSEIGFDLRRTTIQIMRHQFNELIQTTNDNTTQTTNDNITLTSPQRKKPKMAVFFSYSRTESTNAVPDEFDR